MSNARICRLACQLALLVPLVFLPGGRAASAAAPATTSIPLFVGQAKVLNQGGVRRIAVGNGRLVTVQVLDDRQLLLLPEAPGQTTLHVWRRNGSEVTYDLNIVPADANRLLNEINALLGPQDKVRARIVGDKIVLEGSNLSAEEAARLKAVTDRYPQVVNLISQVGLEPMVYTDVRILEFRKATLRDIGIRWDATAAGPAFGVWADFWLNDLFRILPRGFDEDWRTPDGRVELPPSERVWRPHTAASLYSRLDSQIQLLANNGDVVVLAEPKLTAKSGGTAKFLVGGEVPIPLANAFGQVTVQFKEYGIKLEVEPVVSSGGVIAMNVLAEISAVDPAVSVLDIPGFLTRRSSTDVNLRFGETLVIAGLMSDEASRAIDKVPGLGDIPIIGELFKSRSFRRNDTDLVILLTPMAIAPDNALNEGLVQGAQQLLDDGRRQLKLAE